MGKLFDLIIKFEKFKLCLFSHDSRFPKIEALRQKWVLACNLNISDDTKNLKICSLHFAEVSQGNRACYLVRDLEIIPTINVPNSLINIPAVSNSISSRSNEEEISVSAHVASKC